MFMLPNFHINYLAILAAVVANMIIGSLWYGPLLGKVWMKEVGFSPDFKPGTKDMLKSMSLAAVGSFLTAYVLNHLTEVWRPSVWNATGDLANYHYGLMAAVFTWLGFYVPQHFNSVAFDGKSWRLFFINSGYSLVSLLAVGQILAHWR